MVLIPGGPALIGAPEHHLSELTAEQPYPRSWFADEAPQHIHTVEAFLLDRYPVTNTEFARFAYETGYQTVAERRGYGLIYDSYWAEARGACWLRPGGPGTSIAGQEGNPVVYVALADAQAYAAWAGKRLPTEQEWEYAAHGRFWQPWPWGQEWVFGKGTTADEWAGRMIESAQQWAAWWQQHRATVGLLPATTPVGTWSPWGDSPFGISDMAGNVSEWTASPYELYDPGQDYDPLYQRLHRLRSRYVTTRGGGWMHWRHQARTTERIACDPLYSNWSLGFRCAADLGRAPQQDFPTTNQLRYVG
ncbi:formylglycine-generating enzyme family protein [Nonomuraea ceibae]|uniref:formylglycine-generating enzyme family protein n=1 Tax=Nonomuraea ceibae TaxID=1935170 RepID=UPI001C5D4342|nr:SUMF1/EgtB/PvdO family nonheme iron enzyme [Nonomuraea ceibae]